MSKDFLYLVKSTYADLKEGKIPKSLISSKIDLETAFKIQSSIVALEESSGRKINGWKASFIPSNLNDTHRKDSMVIAPFYEDHFFYDTNLVNIPKNIKNLVIEVEIGLTVNKDLEGPNVSIAEVKNSISEISTCFEVVGGLSASLSDKGIAPFLATGAGNWGVISGESIKDFNDLNLDNLSTKLFIDNLESTLQPLTNKPVCPFKTVTSLANNLHKVGRRVKTGELIITGARAYKAQAKEGLYEGTIESIGKVKARVN